MLRGSSLSTATVSVVRSDSKPETVLRALSENRGSDTIQVLGRPDGTDPLALTLDIYVQSSSQAAAATTTTTQTSHEKPDAVPSFARKCSWASLKQLRKDVLRVVGDGDSCNNTHDCEQCAQIAAYLEYCFERPAVFDRTWSGVMVLSATKVSHFVNTLMRMVDSLDQDSDSHEKVAAVVSSFLVPGFKKTE